MSARKPISKSLRFEVFKRDQFVCRYCGNHPPEVILEVDHIIPVCDGGENEMDNLVCSCHDCNRGKGARSLDALPEPLRDRSAEMAERREQLRAYYRLMEQVRQEEEEDLDCVDEVFGSYYQDCRLTESFRNQIRMQFLRRLGLPEVIEAMEIACSKGLNQDRATKYFCGVCWNKIKEIKK